MKTCSGLSITPRLTVALPLGYVDTLEGELNPMVDIPILAKVDDMQKVEDVQMIVAHMAMQRILRELRSADYAD